MSEEKEIAIQVSPMPSFNNYHSYLMFWCIIRTTVYTVFYKSTSLQVSCTIIFNLILIL